MEVYEIYDASEAQLVQELQRLQQLQASSVTDLLARLQALITQELQERGSTAAILNSLGVEPLEEPQQAASAATSPVALRQDQQRTDAPAASQLAEAGDPETTAPGGDHIDRQQSVSQSRDRLANVPATNAPGNPQAARQRSVSQASDGLAEVEAELGQAGEPPAPASQPPELATEGSPVGEMSTISALPQTVLEAAMAAFKAERKQIWKAKKARMDDGWGFAGAGEKKKERPKVSAPGPLPWKAPAVRKAADASTKPALQGSLPGESSRARLSQVSPTRRVASPEQPRNHQSNEVPDAAASHAAELAQSSRSSSGAGSAVGQIMHPNPAPAMPTPAHSNREAGQVTDSPQDAVHAMGAPTAEETPSRGLVAGLIADGHVFPAARKLDMGTAADPASSRGSALDVGTAADPTSSRGSGLDVGTAADPTSSRGSALDVGTAADPTSNRSSALDMGTAADATRARASVEFDGPPTGGAHTSSPGVPPQRAPNPAAAGAISSLAAHMFAAFASASLDASHSGAIAELAGGSAPGSAAAAQITQTLFGERKAAAARTSQEPPEERAAQAAAHTRPQRGGFASPGEESDEEASASQADSQAESEERDLDYGHHPASAHGVGLSVQLEHGAVRPDPDAEPDRLTSWNLGDDEGVCAWGEDDPDAHRWRTTSSVAPQPAAPQAALGEAARSADEAAERSGGVCCTSYNSHFASLAQIFTVGYQANPQASWADPSSGRRTQRAGPEQALAAVQQQLAQRCQRWLKIHSTEGRHWPARSVRYVRIVGNSAHPEVEELVRRTLQELGGWEEERDDEEDQDASLQLTSRSSTPAAGGKPASSGRPQLWNLMWSWSARVPVSYDALLVWQRVNHYPEARQLTRKDLLQRHLARHQRVFAGGRAAPLFDIMPTTFMLPKEYVQFVQAFSEAEGGQEASIPQPPGTNLWIMKPVGQSRGRGIVLLNNVHDVLYGEPMVLQRYVAQPMLIDGYKFDLRLYVVVTSFAPLEAWLYGEGFARFTTQPYSLAPDLIHNRLVHLTNSAVQSQRGAQAGLPDHLHGNEQHLAGDSKCSLARLWGLLRDRGMSQEALWSRISQLVLVALFAVQDAIPHQPNSFELFGFDVMVDSNLKAWLVEVNSSPSLSTDTPLDREIKGSLMRDLITLVNPLDFDREALLRVLQRDSAAGSKAHGPASRRPLGRTQSTANRRQTLNDDMTAILRGQLPRAYGEAPQCGLFQQLAPSKAYDSMMRLKRPMQTPSQ